jgi:hypothetical protein
VGYVYLPYDVHGNMLTDHGKPIERDAYVDYLRAVLPARYMTSRHWTFVKDDFLFNDKWGNPEPFARKSNGSDDLPLELKAGAMDELVGASETERKAG